MGVTNGGKNPFWGYSRLSLSRTLKGPENLFEIERVRDGERKIGYSLHKGTENLVRDREKFEIEAVNSIRMIFYSKVENSDKREQIWMQENNSFVNSPAFLR